MINLYFNNAFSKQPVLEAIETMLPYFREEYENPLTESEGGERAARVLEQSRQSVASLIHAQPEDIYFVSSGTEANNWALKGAAFAHQKKKNHIVISQIEHFSVFQTAQYLERQGFEVTAIPVSPEGFVDEHEIANSVRPSTMIVSIQAASDEIGVIQNIAAIASLKKRFDSVLFHTDAIQYLCYEELSVAQVPFDLVSISSNALYGPPGIAALFVRSGTRIVPLIHGGMQEGGKRPGLQSIALAAGFGEAAKVCRQSKKAWKHHIAQLQEQCFQQFDGWNLKVTGSRACRLVDNLHVIADVDGEALLTLLSMEGISASSGSTCYQFAQKESHVLSALNISREEAQGSILFTLSKDHDREGIGLFLERLGKSIAHLRNIKP